LKELGGIKVEFKHVKEKSSKPMMKVKQFTMTEAKPVYEKAVKGKVLSARVG
jgi:hypothetical protein